MLNDILQFIGFLTCVAVFTLGVIVAIQKFQLWLAKRSLVKDVIKQAKIEYKERNK